MFNLIKNSKIYSVFLFIFSVTFLVSCNSSHQKDFKWDNDIKQLTGGDLDEWLHKASFENELKSDNPDENMITNADVVFPFIGNYYNAVEKLNDYYVSEKNDASIFKNKTVLYKDPKWGDLCLNSVLLFEPEEVYLKDFYTTTGNPAFSGTNAIHQSYSAHLAETSVFTNTYPTIKTGIYEVSIQNKMYLLGFYQKGKLVFEIAIAYTPDNLPEVLNKLKSVNTELGLNVKEWEAAKPEDVKPLPTKNTFWKNPYVGLYPDRYMLNMVELKLKDTPFQSVRNPEEGEYAYQYQSEYGTVSLFTFLKKATKSKTEFNADKDGFKEYKNDNQRIFYKEENDGKQIKGRALIYAKDSNYVELHYLVPVKDTDSQAMIHKMLQTLKVRSF
ncbi:hypothetical protein [Zunongwangia sp.]|uniref:hypothetical protein n=1 Tax=Zunongwangia sp. TaxID=1965325 RepID=UPI003AA8A6E6